jgi:hypothetical protein
VSPFNTKASAQWADVEVLKYPPVGLPVKSVVLDPTDVVTQAQIVQVKGQTVGSFNSLDRNYLPAGTILKLSATNTDKHVVYGGTGTIEGVLSRPIDIAAQASNAFEPAPMFYRNCVFATQAIVGFTLYASALISTLKTCAFE